MPELPDVEVLRQYVGATSLHRPVADVSMREEMVTGTAPQTIRRRLRGAELSGARRHGKHLFIGVSGDGWLRLHFAMTGTLDASEGIDRAHTELRIDFRDGGHLGYVSKRKLGDIALVSDVDVYVDREGLGPDALDGVTSRGRFREVVRQRHGTIKSTLMNQQVMAGLGNVYVDEILFQAEVHPESDVGALSERHLNAIFGSMRHVLDEAIARRADVGRMPGSWLLPSRHPDGRCPRCGGELTKSEVAGRATYVCPDHQQLIG